MRALSALFLSLVLAIGSMSMAMARGQPPMGDTIVLCTGTGTVTVALDAEGNPQPVRAHLCPDCLSATTAFIPPAAPVLPNPQTLDRPMETVEAARQAGGHISIPCHARDPPTAPV